jgi:hypothetical protein
LMMEVDAKAWLKKASQRDICVGVWVGRWVGVCPRQRQIS